MPKPKLDDSVSLFPFLDIMASLIGILVLLITAATLAQIGQTVEDAADAEAVKKAQSRIVQYRAIRKRLAAETREQERLRELVEQAEAARQQLEQLRAEVARLEAQQHLSGKDRHGHRQELKRLQEQIEQAEPELEKLQKQLAELRSLLANRQESGQSEIQILPSGSGYDLEPTFVECAANAVVLHDRAEPLRILVGQLASHPEFAKLLDTVKQQPKGTIVFLVRPDGAST